MTKTNTKGLFRETIEKLTNDCIGGSYLVLRSKHVVPGGRSLISIGYKYKGQKVIYFIITDNTGIAQAYLTYLSKYPDHFTNVYIHPVDCPLVVSKFFVAVNEFDFHKNQGSMIC